LRLVAFFLGLRKWSYFLCFYCLHDQIDHLLLERKFHLSKLIRFVCHQGTSRDHPAVFYAMLASTCCQEEGKQSDESAPHDITQKADKGNNWNAHTQIKIHEVRLMLQDLVGQPALCLWEWFSYFLFAG
jgi:hypothetical protein